MSLMQIRTQTADGTIYTLAPSDLTFLLHECRRCFWLKITAGDRRPQTPMPSVFSRMDRQQRDFFHLRRSGDIDRSLPAGVITCRDLSVTSEPLSIPGARTQLRFRGALDALLRFDQGGFGIVDFKTSAPGDSQKANYHLQLQAYALALENAEWPSSRLAPVTHLGLLCFDPDGLQRVDGNLSYRMQVSWIPMKRSDEDFLRFLGHICSILERPKAPLASPDCKWCAYRGQA